MGAGRPPGPPEPPPIIGDLLSRGIKRQNALIAVRVATLRCGVPLTQHQLASRAKVNATQIQGIERGADPSFSTALKVARALQLHSLDELLAPPILLTLADHS